ncbi:MAG: SLC13 family permease [Halanaerobiales bacterium]
MNKNVLIIVVTISLILFPFLFESLTFDQQITLGALGGALLLWFTGVISPALVGIMVIISFLGSGVLALNIFWGILFSDITYLLLGIFIIVAAVKESRLPQKIISIALRHVGGNMLKLLFFAPLYLLLVIPDPISRITIILPLFKKIKARLDLKKDEVRSLFSLLYIIIPYVGLASVSIYPLAAPSRLLAFHILNDYQQIDLSFLDWFLLAAPVMVLFIFVLYFTVKYSRNRQWKILEEKVFALKEVMKTELLKRDKRLVYLLMAVLFLFFSRGILHNIDLGIIALFAAFLLFTPLIKYFKMRDFIPISNYPIIMLYISSLMLAEALKTTGILTDFTDYVLSYSFLYDHRVFSLILLSLLLFIIRIIFVSNTASVTIFLPLALNFARELGVGMTWAGMFFLMSFGVTFVLPISWPGYLVYWQEGEYQVLRHVKWGIIVSIIYLLVFYIGAFYYWPLLGI